MVKLTGQNKKSGTKASGAADQRLFGGILRKMQVQSDIPLDYINIILSGFCLSTLPTGQKG